MILNLLLLNLLPRIISLVTSDKNRTDDHNWDAPANNVEFSIKNPIPDADEFVNLKWPTQS